MLLNSLDCTVSMAEFLACSEETFVKKMNEKTKKLGMNEISYQLDNNAVAKVDIMLIQK